MVVLAKKKIYPTSTIDDPSNDQTQSTIEQISNQSNIHHHRPVLSRQNSSTDNQFDGTKRNRTFIIRKAFQTGLNQISNTIRRPVNHNRLSKLDSNNVELIQSYKSKKTKFRKNGWSLPLHPLQMIAYFVFLLMTGLLFFYFLPQLRLDDHLIYPIYAFCILITIIHIVLHTYAGKIDLERCLRKMFKKDV